MEVGADELIPTVVDDESYMRMNAAEKVRCYPFDTRGTDSAFEIVKAYFETVGLSTDFNL